MDRFIELISQLPLGTSITSIPNDSFRLDVPATSQDDKDTQFGEDPITLLEKALERKNRGL